MAVASPVSFDVYKKRFCKKELQRKGERKIPRACPHRWPSHLRAEKQLQAGVEKRQGAKTARESEGGEGGGEAGGNFPDKKARARDALTVTVCIPGPGKRTHPFFLGAAACRDITVPVKRNG